MPVVEGIPGAALLEDAHLLYEVSLVLLLALWLYGVYFADHRPYLINLLRLSIP